MPGRHPPDGAARRRPSRIPAAQSAGPDAALDSRVRRRPEDRGRPADARAPGRAAPPPRRAPAHNRVDGAPRRRASGRPTAHGFIGQPTPVRHIRRRTTLARFPCAIAQSVPRVLPQPARGTAASWVLASPGVELSAWAWQPWGASVAQVDQRVAEPTSRVSAVERPWPALTARGVLPAVSVGPGALAARGYSPTVLPSPPRPLFASHRGAGVWWRHRGQPARHPPNGSRPPAACTRRTEEPSAPSPRPPSDPHSWLHVR